VVLTLGEEQQAFALAFAPASIADGEIVGFNSKLLHSVSAATSDRACHLLAANQAGVSDAAVIVVLRKSH
jgi:hypothetical protein